MVKKFMCILLHIIIKCAWKAKSKIKIEFVLCFVLSYYFLSVVCLWIFLVVRHLSDVCRRRSCEINRRDMWEDFLFYSFVSIDSLKHVLEMVYKNTELEAPNRNNTYCQTKSKKFIFSMKKNLFLFSTYIDESKIVFSCIWLN